MFIHAYTHTHTHAYIESKHKAHLAKASSEAGRAWQRARARMIMAEATGDDEVPNPGLRIQDQLVNAQWLAGWLAAWLSAWQPAYFLRAFAFVQRFIRRAGVQRPRVCMCVCVCA